MNVVKRNFDGNWYKQLNAHTFGKMKLSDIALDDAEFVSKLRDLLLV